jgi:acyl-CoA synthetase (AMP-forming)/AMP-acid ligase II
VLFLDNSIHYVVALYGCWYAGLIAVPVDSGAREREVERVIGHAQPSLILSSAGKRNAKSIAVENEIDFIDVTGTAIPDNSEHHSLGNEAQEYGDADGRTLTNGALLIYTSGTLAHPKGVLLSHDNIYENTASIVDYLELSSTDSAVVVLPFHYSYGNSVLHTHIFVGAKLIIGASMMYPQQVTNQLRASAATGFSGVPSTFSLLLSHSDFRKDPPPLRYITQAGGPMRGGLMKQLCQSMNTKTSLYIMYGQTEATARLTWLPPARIDEKIGSVGIPIRGVDIHVVNKDGGPAEVGQVGEVLARGPNIMQGYWNDSKDTKAVISAGWLHTGDLGFLDADGFLYLHGRASEMIKVGAHRISPAEIEEVILELEFVSEAAVCGIPEEVLGQAVVAFVVGQESAENTRRILAHCRRLLSLHKVPRSVEWVSSLPKTASGKLKKWILLKSYYEDV